MILLFAHHKGGVGKSTLIVNVAAELQRQGRTVLLLEADPTIKTTSTWSKDRENNGLPAIETQQKVGAVRYSLPKLDEQYDYVLVDAAGKDSEEMRSAMGVAHVWVMPLQPAQPDLDATESVISHLMFARRKNPGLRALAVINKAPTNVFSRAAESARDYLTEYPELTVAETVIRDRKAYQDALSLGRGVVEMKDSKARAEIQLLTKEITTWQ